MTTFVLTLFALNNVMTSFMLFNEYHDTYTCILKNHKCQHDQHPFTSAKNKFGLEGLMDDLSWLLSISIDFE